MRDVSSKAVTGGSFGRRVAGREWAGGRGQGTDGYHRRWQGLDQVCGGSNCVGEHAFRLPLFICSHTAPLPLGLPQLAVSSRRGLGSSRRSQGAPRKQVKTAPINAFRGSFPRGPLHALTLACAAVAVLGPGAERRSPHLSALPQIYTGPLKSGDMGSKDYLRVLTFLPPSLQSVAARVLGRARQH